jgi:hypothetical protein
MSRALIILAAISALAGCYNPPYPSESAASVEPPQNTGSAQDTSSMRARRRDGAAGSGSSVGTEQP